MGGGWRPRAPPPPPPARARALFFSPPPLSHPPLPLTPSLSRPAPGAVLVIDDSNCDAHWCVDEAVDYHARLGTVKRLFAVAEEPVLHEGEDGKETAVFVRGVTVAQYNNVPL